jgi:hypothetical protein
VRAFRFGVDCDVCTNRKALVPHRNAPLTETGRLRLVTSPRPLLTPAIAQRVRYTEVEPEPSAFE